MKNGLRVWVDMRACCLMKQRLNRGNKNCGDQIVGYFCGLDSRWRCVDILGLKIRGYNDFLKWGVNHFALGRENFTNFQILNQVGLIEFPFSSIHSLNSPQTCVKSFIHLPFVRAICQSMRPSHFLYIRSNLFP